ncbi:MAG: sensor histidine kinase [Bacillota bacterium]
MNKMRRVPLFVQILIVSVLVLALMAILGNRLVLPALEAPYLDQQYEDLEYRLNDYKDRQIIRNDPSYIYLRRNEEDLISISDNTLEIDPTFIASYLRQLEVSDDDPHHGSFNLQSDNTKRFYFVYQQEGDEVYFTGTIADIHPFFSNQVITNQMVGLILVAFFVPVIAIIIWSLTVSKSIHSLKRIYKSDDTTQNKKRPLILSREMADLESALNDYEEEVKTHDQQKQKLFQNISHELRTPVTTIQSYAEAIEDGVIKDLDVVETSKTIQAQTKTLMKTLNQIMNLNKLVYKEQNPSTTEKDSTVNIGEIMFDIFNDYQKNHENLTIHANLDPIVYRGDYDTWRTVLTNILDNNIRHGADTISVQVSKQKIIVDNNGETIPPELLKRLFTPYTHGTKGSFGLGLTIIEKSLNQFDYEIGVENIQDGVRYTIKDARK